MNSGSVNPRTQHARKGGCSPEKLSWRTRVLQCPHEWITPLQLLSCGSLFRLSFSSTLKQFLKSIVKGISNCIWPIDYKRQPSPMALQYSLHPGAQKRMFGWLIEGHELVNYNLEFLVIWKKYLKSVLTQSLKFRWCIRRSWVLHKPLCS